ncbi:MAG: ABC transporter permease [Nitrososphaerales archaeon]|nr:ABC transporter permease [Nitrososphaerales archaeon]
MALEQLLLVVVVVGMQQAVTVALAAEGELITEKSGIINIGIEGTMLISAFMGGFVNWFTEGTVGIYSPLLGLLGGAAIGMVLNFIFAFISTKLHVDQVIAGIGINVFAGGITVLGVIGTGVLAKSPTVNSTPLANQMPSLFYIPGLASSGGISPLEILMFISPLLAYFLLYRTRFGLHIRAVGENPKAAEAAGLNVARTRILATAVGGAFLGMSGAYLSVVLSNYFVRGMTRGLGFIALSAVIAGAWSPVWVLGVSILFGLSWGVYVQFNSALGLTFLFGSLPYLVTVVVLSISSRRLRPPAALGLPYRKE